LIVHEPTFYSNEEAVDLNNPLHRAKKELIESAGITIFRYHDHPHCMKEDLIDISTIKYSGLKGEITGKPYWAITEFVLDEPLTGAELRDALRTNLNAKWSRIAGEMNKKGTVIAFACGTPGHIMELLLDDRTDFIVTGEVCEWIYGEFVRDLAAIGKNKALIIMGHCRSEYAGMIEVSRILQEKFPQVTVCHIESGDVYK
jgi:putative NIF3 family GTP cyclohydrolase 1 type 2